MYNTNKQSNNHTNTTEANRKKKEELRRKAYKENRGNWPYSFFQKSLIPTKNQELRFL